MEFPLYFPHVMSSFLALCGILFVCGGHVEEDEPLLVCVVWVEASDWMYRCLVVGGG